MSKSKVRHNQPLLINGGYWDKIAIHDMQIDNNLVRCYKRLFPNFGAQKKKMLMIGFGEGQNLLYFFNEGFSCSGTEISKKRFKHLKSKIGGVEGKDFCLKLVNSNQLPFVDDSFDVVVAWQSIYYNDADGLSTMLSEIYRVLKKDVIFLSSMLSQKHKLCCSKIGKNIFHPSSVPDQIGCIVYGFRNKNQIRNIYRQFRYIKIGYYASSMFTSYDFHYVIFCKK